MHEEMCTAAHRYVHFICPNARKLGLIKFPFLVIELIQETGYITEQEGLRNTNNYYLHLKSRASFLVP
jgi:hypothetical protein